MSNRSSCPLFILAVAMAVLSGPGPVISAPCASPPPGLVGWWKLEGNALDVTGQHNGTVIGGSFTAGEVGQGYAPSAIGDGVEVPHHPALNILDFTIDAWVLLQPLHDLNISLIWKGDPFGIAVTSPFGLGVYGVNGGPPALAGRPFVTIGNGAQFQELDGSVTAPIGTFFHLAATADGTTLNLYLDGQLIGSAPQLIAVGGSTYPLQIGGVTVPGSVNPGPTVIDEVEIHDVAASEGQIRAVYEAGASGKCLATTTRSTIWGSLKTRYR